MKWEKHFIAKDGSCCAFAGTEDTAVLGAKQRSDNKGKVVMIDEHCHIMPINGHEGRQFAMGIYSSSLSGRVFAFENAALRDGWVAMLTAQREVEVRCFLPRMRLWVTRLLVLQVSLALVKFQAEQQQQQQSQGGIAQAPLTIVLPPNLLQMFHTPPNSPALVHSQRTSHQSATSV